MKHKILLMEDHVELRTVLAANFRERGFDVIEASDEDEMRSTFAGPQPAVALVDLKFPRGNGMDMLSSLKTRWPDTEAIVLTGHGNLDLAVEATKRGAFHFQTKPHNEGLYDLVQRAIQRKLQSRGNASLRGAGHPASEKSDPVFHSPAMRSVLHIIHRVAASDVPVLITGESGTGKEVIADLIHASSQRSKGPFIKINCAALPRELIESELFGSVKGAFTGAQGDREGLFRQAGGGTLFLDELSEMPIDTQSKLLRVLQEKEVRPVGGRTSHKIDCRILAATNRRTDEAIQSGRLREDLYYRLSAIRISLPPLRERRADILPLARLFLKQFAAEADRGSLCFTAAAEKCLLNHPWPGNVRQLQNEVQRATLLSEASELDVLDLSIHEPLAASEPPPSNPSLLSTMERNAIIEVLEKSNGNKKAAARSLGIGRQTLYKKIRTYAIPCPVR